MCINIDDYINFNGRRYRLNHIQKLRCFEKEINIYETRASEASILVVTVDGDTHIFTDVNIGYTSIVEVKFFYFILRNPAFGKIRIDFDRGDVVNGLLQK